MLKSLLTLAAGATLAVGAALPASAGTTPTTFTLTSGELSISVPETANLGSAALGDGSLVGHPARSNARGQGAARDPP